MTKNSTSETQPSRRAGVAKSVTLEPEAAAILESYCPPGRKGTGKFLSRLLYEFEAMLHERHRLRHQLKTSRQGEGEEAIENISPP
jgi:hypothetical protein